MDNYGVHWEFRAREKIMAVFSTAIEDHYQSQKLGRSDNFTVLSQMKVTKLALRLGQELQT